MRSLILRIVRAGSTALFLPGFIILAIALFVGLMLRIESTVNFFRFMGEADKESEEYKESIVWIYRRSLLTTLIVGFLGWIAYVI